MAKTKHNNFLDTIDDVVTDAKNKGVVHLYTEDESFSGRTVKINGIDMYHFGTTSYLGLGYDDRLKEAAIQAIQQYGTQFPLSKTYLSLGIYKELEESLFKMYGNPVVICKNSTLAHIAVIPSIVRDEDAVILDHQVHYSVHSACDILKARGVKVDMIRHNSLTMLEDKIKALKDKHKKIWYMIDGVYSMFGDCAPFDELFIMMKKYPQLYLYIDDVHGMSWVGKNGTGYAMSKINELPEKIVLISTLSKTFGASGGFMVCADKELSRYVKTFGGPLTFSAQLEPASVGAAVASAQIHLSTEIYELQKDLKTRIHYCNSLLTKTTIPFTEENDTPVFFIGTGLPSAGYNLSKRLMNEGFYVNLGIFPAVPIKNTGIRFTISKNNELEDIKKLIDAIDYHYPKMLEEEEKSINDIRKVFRMPIIEEKTYVNQSTKQIFNIQREKTINAINATEWNTMFGDKSNFDHQGLQFMERIFTLPKNLPENKWEFEYIIIKDKNNQPLLATFVTTALWKEDMLSPASVSIQVEEIRKKNHYHLTSKVVSTGSLFSEGDHVFLNRTHPEWKNALKELLDLLSDIQEKNNASMIVLREFDLSDNEIKDILLVNGFFKVDVPEVCTIEDISWKSTEDYLAKLSDRSRRHIKYDVLKLEHEFNIEVIKKPTEEHLTHFYKLYQNVKEKNFDLNMFSYPIDLFIEMSKDPRWEFITLSIKPTSLDSASHEPVAVMFNYINEKNDYCFMLVGMNYDYLEKYKIYKQSIYQVIKRAKELNCRKVFLGISASLEKKKFGATILPKVAYIQARDNFNIDLLHVIRSN